MNITIAIADTDRTYLERLVEVLQEYTDLSISAFTSVDILEKSLNSKRFDIVLFDPGLCNERIIFYNTKAAICLYSDEAENTALYRECDKILKYQRISKIYKDLIKVYASKAGYIPDFDNSQNTKLFAVYSPAGGSGKTTIGLVLANICSSLGKNVLFLSMEQLDSSSCINEHSEEDDGVTVLFNSLDDDVNFELKLKGIVKKGANGVSYVEGFERVVDYNSVSGEEMKTALEKIIKYGNYETVVVDMDCRIDDIGQNVFEKADKIILVGNYGETADKKMEMFLKQAIAHEYLDKMFKIMNFAGGYQTENRFSEIPIIGKIPDYGNQTMKNLVLTISEKAAINVNLVMGKN